MALWEFETVPVSNGFGVVLGRSYFWRQAQVCMSLARASDDPVHKQTYQDLALEFVLKANNGLDITDPPPAANKPKPAGGSAYRTQRQGKPADISAFGTEMTHRHVRGVKRT